MCNSGASCVTTGNGVARHAGRAQMPSRRPCLRSERSHRYGLASHCRACHVRLPGAPAMCACQVRLPCAPGRLWKKKRARRRSWSEAIDEGGWQGAASQSGTQPVLDPARALALVESLDGLLHGELGAPVMRAAVRQPAVQLVRFDYPTLSPNTASARVTSGSSGWSGSTSSERNGPGEPGDGSKIAQLDVRSSRRDW